MPYAAGLEHFAAWMAGDGGEDLAAVATLVGSLVLARAARGTDLSKRVLKAGAAAVKKRDG